MIKANFTAYDTYITDSLYQWDKNQVLTVEGLNITVAPEVHFSNAEMDRAIVRQAQIENGVLSVKIPNSVLQSSLTVLAYIGIYEGDTFKIIEVVEIPIIAKKKPEDYTLEVTDEEVYSFKAMENLVNNTAKSLTEKVKTLDSDVRKCEINISDLKTTTRTDITTLSSRVDNIIANNNDTKDNSELVDIRIGVDGITYISAGTAVREQIGQLRNEFDDNKFVLSRRINLFNKNSDDNINGQQLTSYGTTVANDESVTTHYIPITQGIYKFVSSSKYGHFYGALYDDKRQYMSYIDQYSEGFDNTNGDVAYIKLSFREDLLDELMIVSLEDYYLYCLGNNTNIIYHNYNDIICEGLKSNFDNTIGVYNKNPGVKISANAEEVFNDYGVINLLNGYEEGCFWHATTYKKQTPYDGRCVFNEISIDLTDEVQTFYIPVGSIELAIWALNNGVMEKIGTIITSVYGAHITSFSINKNGVTDIYINTGTKENDITFNTPQSRIFLLPSGWTDDRKNTVLTTMADISEYYPNGVKKIEFSDVSKEFLIKQIFTQSETLTEQVKQLTKPLYGKTLIVFGDSEMQYLSDTADNVQMYKDLLSISEYKSYAVAGNTWEADADDTDIDNCSTGILGQLNRLYADIESGVIDKDNIGAIIWQMGTNGQNQGEFWETEGSEVNTDITTMCGAMHVFMNKILTDFTSVDIRLMGIIPLQGANRNEYFGDKGLMVRHNLIRDIHRCWSIPFLDMQYEGEIPAKKLLNCDNGTLGDVVHWSSLGMKIAIRKICGKLITV